MGKNRTKNHRGLQKNKMRLREMYSKISLFIESHKFTFDFLLAVFAFIFSFFFSLAFTKVFPFFWEDIQIQLYPVASPSFIFFIQQIFSRWFENFFSVGYMTSRPFQAATWSLLYSLFGAQIIFYRIFKSLFAAGILLILYLFLRKYSNRLFAFLGLFYYLLFPELWLSTVYSQDIGLYMHFFTLLALFLFFVYYRKLLLNNPSKKYVKLFFLFFFIIILTKISILFKHEGRIVFFILALFGVFNIKLLKKPLFIALTLALAAFSMPWGGIVRKIFDSSYQFLTGVGSVQLSKSELVSLFLSRLEVPFSTLGKSTVFLLLLSLLLVLTFLIRTKITKIQNLFCAQLSPKMKDSLYISIFSLFWFIFAFVLVFFARLFDYPPLSFQRYDFLFFLAPYTLLLISFSYFSYSLLKHKFLQRAIFILFSLILLISIFSHLYSLNLYRGAWGDYFIGWDNVKDYVNQNYQNAVVLTAQTNNYPTWLFDSTNRIEFYSDLNEDFLKEFREKYSNVLIAQEVNIANRAPLNMNEYPYLELVTKLKVKDPSFYSRFKKIFGLESKAEFWIYKYNPSQGAR